jgi:hypothetical protein
VSVTVPRRDRVPTIVVVKDNLGTHKPASLYEAFPAAEAHRLVMLDRCGKRLFTIRDGETQDWTEVQTKLPVGTPVPTELPICEGSKTWPKPI